MGIVLCIIGTEIFTVLCALGVISGFVMLLKRKVSLLIFALLFLGGGIYGNYTNTKITTLEKYADIPCSGEMFVTDIDSLGDEYVRVKATVTKIDEETINEPVLFTIYGIKDIDVNKRIYFDNLKFKIPDEERNDGGFNNNRYLKSIGIRVTAGAEVNKLKASGSDGFVVFKFFRTLKQEFARRCKSIWGESHASGIIPAILVGNDIYISGEVNGLFSGAGITHILVASGMHVAVVALIFSFLLFPFRNKRWIYNLLLGTAIICFAMLVGYAPSIVRAVTAYFIYLIARKLLRSADPVTVLFEAMTVILVINPMSVYSLSFQLSFSAVFGIIVFTPHLIERLSWFLNLPVWSLKLRGKLMKLVLWVRNWIINSAAVSMSAMLGVLPIMMNAFGGSSVFSVFINIIIAVTVPAIYGLGIVSVIFNVEPFVTLTKWLCDALVAMAEFTVEIPGNYMSFSQSNILTVSITVFVIACLIRCKIKKFTPFFEPVVFACALAVVMACPIISYIPPNEAEVAFLNVGQGDCAVIRLADRKTVVVDTGTESMCVYELLPYLGRKNITEIDTLIISHNDNDHAGGVVVLTQSVKVDKIVTNQFVGYDFEDTEHISVRKGDKFSVGNAGFEVLSPDEKHKSDNDNSLVVRMDFGESSFLFTGDAGEKIEKELENVDVDVLKAAHHGAKNTNTQEFLQRVSPKYCVISVDKDNSYGHPDENVLGRLEYISDAVFRTDRDKTITVNCDIEGNLKLTNRLNRIIINNRK